MNAIGRLRRIGAELRVVMRAVAFIVRVAPVASATFLLLVLVLGVLPVAQVWLIKRIVDTAARGIPDEATTVLWFGAGYGLTLVLAAALGPLQLALGAWLEDRSVAEVDRSLMRAAVRLPDLVRIERPAFGDELRVLQDVPMWLPRLFPALQRGLGAAISLLGLLVLLGGLQPLIPLALAVLSIPHLVGEYRLHQLQYQALADRARTAREMAYCVRITTEPDAAKEVRVFGLGAWFVERYRARAAPVLAEMTRLRFNQLQLSGLFSAGYVVALGASFWYVAAQATSGGLSLGDVALYLAAIIQAQGVFLQLRVGVAISHEIALHVGAFFAFVDQAAPAIAMPPAGQGRRAPARLKDGIELRNVAFGYPESTTPVLDDVSVTLRAGTVTALVGANGAGKSTLVKLLTRMYDPTGGEVTLDGWPLAAYDLASLRSRIAVMYQDFTRFSLTLGENIAVGDGGADVAAGQVETAAQLAGADAVAGRLPQGYATALTRRFEDGVEVSGGEWQKVALARSFLRDAALVILDEPTAALDAEAEEQLFGRFRSVMAGRTGLLISHRFSTVRMADHIVVVEDGRVLEQGSHTDLVGRGGRYAELFEMQAGRYRDHDRKDQPNAEEAGC